MYNNRLSLWSRTHTQRYTINRWKMSEVAAETKSKPRPKKYSPCQMSKRLQLFTAYSGYIRHGASISIWKFILIFTGPAELKSAKLLISSSYRATQVC